MQQKKFHPNMNPVLPSAHWAYSASQAIRPFTDKCATPDHLVPSFQKMRNSRPHSPRSERQRQGRHLLSAIVPPFTSRGERFMSGSWIMMSFMSGVNYSFPLQVLPPFRYIRRFSFSRRPYSLYFIYHGHVLALDCACSTKFEHKFAVELL